MDITSKQSSLLFLLLSVGYFTIIAQSSTDFTAFVFRGCAKQAFSDPLYTQELSTLFASLVSQSSKYKFFKTTSGSGQTSLSGLFQCRGDLNNVDCYKCVSRLPEMSQKHCGKAVAARVQLFGCYILYQVSGFADVSGMQMLYKTCGSTNVAGAGFEQRRDAAFTALSNGVVSSHGFYTTSYEAVYVLAQCEGDLSDADCGSCVKSAVQRAESECKGAISGQVYLHRCFVSYSYYPNGVPRKPLSDSSSSSSSSGTGQNTGKTVAIILGGAAAVGFLIILLMFARNLLKKHDDY